MTNENLPTFSPVLTRQHAVRPIELIEYQIPQLIRSVASENAGLAASINSANARYRASELAPATTRKRKRITDYFRQKKKK